MPWCCHLSVTGLTSRAVRPSPDGNVFSCVLWGAAVFRGAGSCFTNGFYPSLKIDGEDEIRPGRPHPRAAPLEACGTPQARAWGLSPRGPGRRSGVRPPAFTAPRGSCAFHVPGGWRQRRWLAGPWGSRVEEH